MPQGTGQASRQAGKEKAQGKDSAARTRSGTSRRRSAQSPNGRTASKGSAGSGSKGGAAKQTAAKRGSTASKRSSNASKRGSTAAKRGSTTSKRGSNASKPSTASKGSTSKAVAKRATKATPRSRRKLTTGKKLAQTARQAIKATVPVAHQVKELSGHLPDVTRAAAAPVGAAGAGLATAGLAARAVRRRRRGPAPPVVAQRRLRSAGKKLAHAATNIPRPHLRPSLPATPSRRPHLPHPSRRGLNLPGVGQLPSLPNPADLLPNPRDALWVAAIPAGVQAVRKARHLRRLPIQQCIDVAVPIHVAYDEWMRLEFLPEGCHRVEKIERAERGKLRGRVAGSMWPRRWEAEILDDRDCESFAWRSVRGSDCAGLITFHSLGERLTRLELQLDIVPVRPQETALFVLRMADARTRSELRRLKARLETINPDSYGDNNPKEG